MTPSTTLTPSSTSNQNSPQANRTPFITSNHKSLTPPTNDSSLYKSKINTPHNNIPSDRSRHFSENQTDSLPPLTELRKLLINYDRTKLYYRLFIPPSKL